VSSLGTVELEGRGGRFIRVGLRDPYPYPAEFSLICGVPYHGHIVYGHSPWLFARLVDKLVITGRPSEEEASWVERRPPKVRMPGDAT
jgi:hypothetical protein